VVYGPLKSESRWWEKVFCNLERSAGIATLLGSLGGNHGTQSALLALHPSLSIAPEDRGCFRVTGTVANFD